MVSMDTCFGILGTAQKGHKTMKARRLLFPLLSIIFLASCSSQGTGDTTTKPTPGPSGEQNVAENANANLFLSMTISFRKGKSEVTWTGLSE